MHSCCRSLLIAIVFVTCLPCLAAPVEVNVSKPDGSALKDALVIVQDLQGKESEVFRALTDEHGNIPSRTLPAGLYRAIATYPYSPWRTSVQEFLVLNAPVQVHLRLQEADGLDSISVASGQLSVTVLDSGGHPAQSARVLVRDDHASPSSEHWGTTNAQGRTTLELTGTPDVLVVVYHDRLYSFPANGFDTERTLRLK